MGNEDLEFDVMKSDSKLITTHTLENYDRRNQKALDKEE